VNLVAHIVAKNQRLPAAGHAADFCGTEGLRDASRDLVEAFMSTLAAEAAKDRAALICKLNSYNQLAEVKP